MNEIEKAIQAVNDFNSHKISEYTLANHFNTILSALEQQKNDRWVPITNETNPQKSDIYLATFEENGNRYVERFYYSDYSGWMMPVNWQDEGRIDKMLAWKPLPEPYKEEQP